MLHVDHVKPRAKFPELALDINNLQILCETCNLGKLHYCRSHMSLSSLDTKKCGYRSVFAQ
ncbi:HNH endonuclease [Bowmanella sp. JS7-9]|uniref:HNH endonuclease n=1 Tax=Pseudobowmanella zhangzhouensis TaxID=1537679 RepID=A0ABW1XKC0_9ALTE